MINDLRPSDGIYCCNTIAAAKIRESNDRTDNATFLSAHRTATKMVLELYTKTVQHIKRKLNK